MVNVVLPLLNSHEYLQPAHLLRSDGTQNYTYDDDVVFYKDKVYIRPEKCANYTELDRETYNTIKNKAERDVS